MVEKVVKDIVEVQVQVPAPYEVEKLVEVERVTEKLVPLTSQVVKVASPLENLTAAHLRLSFCELDESHCVRLISVWARRQL